MKNIRRILITCTVLIVAVLLGMSYYMIEFSLSHDRSNWKPEHTWDFMYEHYPWANEWLDSIRQNNLLADTFVLSEDGRKLHAYYLPCLIDSTSGTRTAVLIHGYKNNALGMLHLGYMYHHDLHCNILLPDLHAHGLSEGEYIRMGWLDRLDVLRWCQIADSLFQVPIVVHGISMGAATTMMLSGEDNLPQSITHFVEDCGYTSVWDEFKGELKAQFSLPEFPLMYTSSLMCKILQGWGFSEASSLNQVSRATKPMLFIHGDADRFVPFEMVHSLYEAHPGDKQIWLPEGVTHAVSYDVYPEEYTQRVKAFLEK